MHEIERHARGVLAPGERLVAAVRATTLGPFGGQLGSAGTLAVGALVQWLVMSRSAKRAALSGFPAAPHMAVGLTDRRVLVWKASGLSNRPRELLGEISLDRVTDVAVDERFGHGMITFSLRAVPPVTIAAFKRDQPDLFAEAFRASSHTPAIPRGQPEFVEVDLDDVAWAREPVGVGAPIAVGMSAAGGGPRASFAPSMEAVSGGDPALTPSPQLASPPSSGFTAPLPDPPPPSREAPVGSVPPAEPDGTVTAETPPERPTSPEGPDAPSGSESTETKACPQCGTRSSLTASFCWRCYASFPREAAPAMMGSFAPPGGFVPEAGSGGPAAQYAPAGQYATPGIATAAPLPAGTLGDPTLGPPTGRLGYQPSLPTSSKASRSIPLAAKIVAAVAGLAVLFGAIAFLGTRTHPATLIVPDTIAGAQRLESPDLAQAVQQMEEAGKAYGVKGQAAYYGTSNIPTFFFVAYAYHAKASETPDYIFDEFSRGWISSGGGATLDLPTKVTDRAGGTTFVCVRVRGGVPGSLCMWQDSDVIGFVMALRQGLASTRTLTTSVKLSVEA